MTECAGDGHAVRTWLDSIIEHHMSEEDGVYKTYATVYRDGEHQVHRQGCRDLRGDEPVDEFLAENSEDARVKAADIYAFDLDLFDGEFETEEEARVRSLPAVRVLPCALAAE